MPREVRAVRLPGLADEVEVRLGYGRRQERSPQQDEAARQVELGRRRLELEDLAQRLDGEVELAPLREQQRLVEPHGAAQLLLRRQAQRDGPVEVPTRRRVGAEAELAQAPQRPRGRHLRLDRDQPREHVAALGEAVLLVGDRPERPQALGPARTRGERLPVERRRPRPAAPPCARPRPGSRPCCRGWGRRSGRPGQGPPPPRRRPAATRRSREARASLKARIIGRPGRYDGPSSAATGRELDEAQHRRSGRHRNRPHSPGRAVRARAGDHHRDRQGGRRRGQSGARRPGPARLQGPHRPEVPDQDRQEGRLHARERLLRDRTGSP